MDLKKDANRNSYIEIGNIRLTYVKRENRSSIKDWPEADVVRIQAYKGSSNKSLHLGAEFPVYSEKDAFEFSEALNKLLANRNL